MTWSSNLGINSKKRKICFHIYGWKLDCSLRIWILYWENTFRAWELVVANKLEYIIQRSWVYGSYLFTLWNKHIGTESWRPRIITSFLLCIIKQSKVFHCIKFSLELSAVSIPSSLYNVFSLLTGFQRLKSILKWLKFKSVTSLEVFNVCFSFWCSM